MPPQNPDDQIIEKFQSLNPDQRKELLGKMTPQQLKTLHTTLSSKVAAPTAPADPAESGWMRAYKAVGKGFKAPFQEAAETLSTANKAIGRGGPGELLKAFPPQSLGQTLKQAYGSFSPIDVQKTTKGEVDIPATAGASVGRIGAMLGIGKLAEGVLPESGAPKATEMAETAPQVAKRAKALTQASGTSSKADIPQSWRTAVPELTKTVKSGQSKALPSVPNLDKVVQDTLTRTDNDFNLRFQPIANNRIVPTAISDAIRSNITSNMAQTSGGQQLGNFLHGRAVEFEKPWTLRQLNEERMAATDRLHSLRNQAPSGQEAALGLNASYMADKAIEKGTKDIVYGALEKHYEGQVPPNYFANLKRTQSALIDIKDQLDKRLIQLSNMENAPLRERVRMHTYVSSGGHLGGAIGQLGELIFPEYKSAHAAAKRGLKVSTPKGGQGSADLRFMRIAPAAGIEPPVSAIPNQNKDGL